MKKNPVIKVNEGTRKECTENFITLWERQTAAVKECHHFLMENWSEFKPSNITEEKIRRFNQNFNNSEGGNWYFEIFNVMERVKLKMNHPYVGIVNEPLEWKMIEKILENTKKFNDAQAQFQGQPGKYVALAIKTETLELKLESFYFSNCFCYK